MSASEHRIYFLLQRVAHQLKAEADFSLRAACGLTTAQTAALTVIARIGPTNQQQVARALAQRESAITTMALRLLDAGYISREPSRTDARAWELDVTDAGRTVLDRTAAAFGPVNAMLDECFTPKQLETLAKGFRDVLDKIGQDDARPATTTRPRPVTSTARPPRILEPDSSTR